MSGLVYRALRWHPGECNIRAIMPTMAINEKLVTVPGTFGPVVHNYK